MKKYSVPVPIIMWAKDRDEAARIVRKKLDKHGFEYGLTGHGTRVRRSKGVTIKYHSSASSQRSSPITTDKPLDASNGRRIPGEPRSGSERDRPKEKVNE